MKNLELLESYRQNHILFLKKSGRHIWASAAAREEFQLNLFMDALKAVETKIPVMVELGVSQDPTYSVVFNDVFENECLSICTEVIKSNLEIARERCPNSKFIHTYSGKPVHVQEPTPNPEELHGILNVSLKDILNEYSVDKIDMLHIDIQGSEMSLLEEMERDNTLKKVDFLFLSVHPQINNCFTFCKNILDRNFENLEYIFAHPTQGGHGDGLICARLGSNLKK